MEYPRNPVNDDSSYLLKYNKKRLNDSTAFSLNPDKPWYPTVRYLQDQGILSFFKCDSENNILKFYAFPGDELNDLFMVLQSHSPMCTTCKYKHTSSNSSCFLNWGKTQQFIPFQKNKFYPILKSSTPLNINSSDFTLHTAVPRKKIRIYKRQYGSSN